MLRIIISFSIALLLCVYFGYENYQTKKDAQSEIKHLQNIIELKEKQLNFYQKVNDEALQEKLKLHNKSNELTEKLNDALKNKNCADKSIDTAIVKQLYQHADKIRQAASHSTKSY